MRVAVCDDVEIFVDALVNIINVCDEKEFELLKYTSGKELLDNIDKIDIVFLDIDMPEMNGFDVCREIEKRGTQCQIIIASGYEYYKEAFHYSVLRYITKPYQFEEVNEALTAGCDRVRKLTYETISVFKNRIEYHIPQGHIMYVRAYNGYVEFYTKKEIYRKDISLKECSNLLSNDFFTQVNRSIIVGMKYVDREEKGKVFLEDKEINLSRKWRDSYRKKFLKYTVMFVI
jgi:DNA-binding LytR/AlgR family response regulator